MTKPAALAEEINRYHYQGHIIADTDIDRYTSSSKAPSSGKFLVTGAKSYISTPQSSLRCMCYTRPQTIPWSSPYRLLGMGTFAIAQHRKECPLSSFQRGVEISLRYRFPRWLLNKAMHINLGASYGAGGLSLAPNLGIIPVSTWNNPALEIISNHRASVHDLVIKLRQIFLDGKASPFDIDENGQNLIHVSRSCKCLRKVINTSSMLFIEASDATGQSSSL